jgi:hypothetical protein
MRIIMIARFTVLFPFKIHVREGDSLPPHEFDQDGYHIKIYPPMAAMIDYAAFEEGSGVSFRSALQQIKPAEQQIANQDRMIDGAPTISANLIQIDFMKDDFDRRKPKSSSFPAETEGDPPLALMISVLNGFLGRLRAMIRGVPIRQASSESLWRMRYLDDNGEELPINPELIRGRTGGKYTLAVVGLNAATWEKANSLPSDYVPPTWDTLLLDAVAMLPEIGAALVLANAALEIFIATTLDSLARLKQFPSDLWHWINDRDDDYRKQPSVKEEYDILLKTFAGKSLKEENDLWTSFVHLRDARNSFAHNGIAMIGKGKKTIVTLDDARHLINEAHAIVDWIEKMLPDELRRPRIERQANLMVQMQIS